MPPRTTQQSHRPRVSDRTMVGTSPPRSLQALRHGTKNAATDGPGSGATQRSRTEPHTGLDVRQLPLPAEREKYFLLTSPFIEPAEGIKVVRCPRASRARQKITGAIDFLGKPAFFQPAC